MLKRTRRLSILLAILIPCGMAYGFVSPGRIPLHKMTKSQLEQANALQNALRNPRLKAATREFGNTIIDMASLPFSSPVLDSGKRPWSSWWYPRIDHDFTKPRESHRTPILEKYDLFARTLGTPSSALAYESNRIMGNFATWEGLCDAWAIASLVYPEPRRSVTFQTRRTPRSQPETVEMSVFDLKGILLKTFEAVPEDQFDIFGEKYLGNSRGWIHPDLFADEFHRLVEIYLGERRQGFLMDHDAGVEVWSVPVFKANFRYSAVPGKPNEVNVKLWLFTAAPAESNQKDMVGIHQLVREYTYTLTGELDSTGRYLKITDGDWTGESANSHPDYILVPKQEHVLRKSWNPYIQIHKVDELMLEAI